MPLIQMLWLSNYAVTSIYPSIHPPTYLFVQLKACTGENGIQTQKYILSCGFWDGNGIFKKKQKKHFVEKNVYDWQLC